MLSMFKIRLHEDWFYVGLSLGISADLLNEINKDQCRSRDKCFCMFKTWLKVDCSPCYCKLISAVVNEGNLTLATEIRKAVEANQVLAFRVDNYQNSLLHYVRLFWQVEIDLKTQTTYRRMIQTLVHIKYYAWSSFSRMNKTSSEQNECLSVYLNSLLTILLLLKVQWENNSKNVIRSARTLIMLKV